MRRRRSATAADAVPVRARGDARRPQRARPFSIEGSWNSQFGSASSPDRRRVGRVRPRDRQVPRRVRERRERGLRRLRRPELEPATTSCSRYANVGDRLTRCPVRAGSAPARDRRRAGDRTPVAGATVAGAASGGGRPGDGRASLRPRRGPARPQGVEGRRDPLQRLRVCVTDGADGACGTTVPPPPPDRTAPVATIAGIRDGQAVLAPRARRASCTAP